MQQESRGDNAIYYHVVKIANCKDVAALAREGLLAVERIADAEGAVKAITAKGTVADRKGTCF